MNAIERMKLSKQLLELRTALQGEQSPLQRMKLSRQILEIRAKLMGAQPAPAGATKAPPAGVYPSMDAFERDTQPLGALARMLMVLLGLKKDDWSTHAIDLADARNALLVVADKGWQQEKELSDPAFSRAYRGVWKDARMVAFDVDNLNRDNPKLKILEKIRGPWVLDFVNRIAEGERAESLKLENYIEDSKGYPKSKGVSIQVQPKSEPASVVQEGTKPHLQTLLAVAQGQHDAEGLQALYERIKGAVEALDGMGALAGVAVEGANEAITHWAELEIKLNG